MAEGLLAPVQPARLSTHFVAAYRLGFGALGLAAILAPLGKQIEEGNSLVNFFSFFTIQSNLMLVVVFIVGGWALLGNRALPNWDLVRGATTAYMATTGTVYVLLLDGLEEDLQTPIPWVNTVLHYWLPLVAVADWILDRPDRGIPFRKALVWLVYPLLYLAYSITRSRGGLVPLSVSGPRP